MRNRQKIVPIGIIIQYFYNYNDLCQKTKKPKGKINNISIRLIKIIFTADRDLV